MPCCWFVASLLSTKTTRSFLGIAAPQAVTSLIASGGSCFLNSDLCMCHCWISEGSCWPVPPPCLGCMKQQPFSWVYQLCCVITYSHPFQCYLQTWWDCTPGLIQVMDKDVKQILIQTPTVFHLLSATTVSALPSNCFYQCCSSHI